MNSAKCKSRADCIDPLFTDQLKALGHPVRLKLVQRLVEQSDRCCGDLCACFDYSQSTISQHLSILVEARLVKGERRGNRMHYTLENATFEAVSRAVQQLTIPPADTGLRINDRDRKSAK